MTKSTRTFVSGLVLASTLLLPGLAQAEPPGGHGRKLERVCEQLSCTEQQERDIQAVFEQLRIDSKQDREAIRTLHEQLAAEWVKDKPDEKAMAKLHDKIAAHERNLADRRHEAMMELHALLSPEQRKQAAELLGKRKGKGKGKGKAERGE